MILYFFMEVECIGFTKITHMEETGITQRTIRLLSSRRIFRDAFFGMPSSGCLLLIGFFGIPSLWNSFFRMPSSEFVHWDAFFGIASLGWLLWDGSFGMASLGWLLWDGFFGMASLGWLLWNGFFGMASLGCLFLDAISFIPSLVFIGMPSFGCIFFGTPSLGFPTLKCL